MSEDSELEPEEMLLELLKDDQIIINNGWWDKDWKEDAITVAVNCSDVFYWASSDAEDINYTDLKEVYKHWKKDPMWGVAVWCIKKRKQPPQKPVLDRIREIGIWDIDTIVKFEEL